MADKRKNIIIYRLGSLGDTLVALPCFHHIRNCYPNSDITLLTNKPVTSKAAPLEAVLGKNGYFFNRIIHYPIGTRNLFLLLSIIWKIRVLGIDTIINLTAARSRKSTFRDKIFFRIAGIKNKIGFPELEEDFNVSVDSTTGDYEWEAKRLGRRLKVLGQIDLNQSHYWDLKLNKQELSEAQFILKDIPAVSKLIVACVGTKMQSKDWGIHNWTHLIKNLSVKLEGWGLIMIGSNEEVESAKICLEVWKGETINLCGKTSPRVSAAILKKAELFIGHDSGPMHLSACVGTPCVAIFSARNLPHQWYPRGDSNHIIYHQTDCAGCNL